MVSGQHYLRGIDGILGGINDLIYLKNPGCGSTKFPNVIKKKSAMYQCNISLLSGNDKKREGKMKNDIVVLK